MWATATSIPLLRQSQRTTKHVRAFSERLVRQALAWEGTASGEHGIGRLKRGFMAEEHGAAVAWMHRLKVLFDPDGLLNPGKLI